MKVINDIKFIRVGNTCVRSDEIAAYEGRTYRETVNGITHTTDNVIVTLRSGIDIKLACSFDAFVRELFSLNT